ncbi:MAG: 2OG-Fe(II) oxygenase family protein [Synechococcus sp. Tobar2m-G35]|nr:2OG-Fe(II) oxygenase family protein [Synechococcus sp. Tobar2m-G35]
MKIEGLFPLALGQVQLRPDPLALARQLQVILELRGKAEANPDPDCAWTGDLNGVWQLHRHPTFTGLIDELTGHAWAYLQALGFERQQVALHLQRCWPVVSTSGQVVGRHHHPNAHLSGVYYLNGDGSGRSGCLRLWPDRQVNELVPGLAVGHESPFRPDARLPGGWLRPWVDLAPRAGLFVLFPSSTDHAVLTNDDDDGRFSISLDFVLTAPAGSAAAEYLAPHPQEWQPLA